MTIFNIDEELSKIGLTRESYENCLKDSSERVQRTNDMDWQEIIEKYNLPFHYDTLRKSQQPTPFGGAFIREYFIDKMSKENTDNNYLKELRLQKQELQKEKQKLSDERVELNRQIRQEARKESYIDLVKRIICEDTEPLNVNVHYSLFDSNTDLLCHLSDIHTGIEINNWKNVFNEDVLKNRIDKYTSDILDIRGQHGSENCYLVIGEIISGLIHNNLRLQNNMDIMEQFKYVSELISAMLVRLANNFSNVHVFITQVIILGYLPRRKIH